MLGRAIAIAFIVGGAMGSLGQGAPAAAGPRSAALQPILEVLNKAKLSASLEFSGPCVEGYIPDFPQFHRTVTSGASALEILRGMLPDNQPMNVTLDPDGTVRIIESGVPKDILNVRMSHISFEGSGRRPVYSPREALGIILRAPEFVAFLKSRDIEWPFRGEAVPGNLIGGRRPSEQPHISGSLDDVTVSQALDHILQTFPGVWVYENCPQTNKRSREFYFGFFYLQRIGFQLFLAE
jgi:hypothetical protein